MELPKWRRVVVKLGTQTVIDEKSGDFASDRVAGLIKDLLSVEERILVTSGAVGLGRRALGLTGALALSQKQACAAVGQSLLMNAYNQILKPYHVNSAQLLVTADDLTSRQKYLNFSETLMELLKVKALPIINENDTVSTAELQSSAQQKSFGDNDKLSAIVAAKMRADLLLILSNVGGFYRSNPKKNKDAERLGLVEDWSQLTSIESDGVSTGGRGGIRTKIEAAKIAAVNGVYTIIADGFEPEIISRLLSLREWNSSSPGTLVLPRRKLSERKAWIGFSANTHGALVINAGALKALLEKQASLLPVGIVQIRGEFAADTIVSIETENGEEIGRGLVRQSSVQLQAAITAAKSADKKSVKSSETIHKDNLVVYRDSTEIGLNEKPEG